jgi:hypothetical protein
MIKSKLKIDNDELAYMLALRRGVMTSENPAAITDQAYAARLTYGGSHEPMVQFTHPGIYNIHLYKEIFAKTGAYSDATGFVQFLSTTYVDWIKDAISLFGEESVGVATINGRKTNIEGTPYFDFSPASQDLAFMAYMVKQVLPLIKTNPVANEQAIFFKLGEEFASLPGAVNAQPNEATGQAIPATREAYQKLRPLLASWSSKQARLNSLLSYQKDLIQAQKQVKPEPTLISSNEVKSQADLPGIPQISPELVTANLSEQARRPTSKNRTETAKRVKLPVREKPKTSPLQSQSALEPKINLLSELTPHTITTKPEPTQTTEGSNPYQQYVQNLMAEILSQHRPEIVGLANKIKQNGWKKVFAKGQEWPGEGKNEDGTSKKFKITVGGELSALAILRRMKNPLEQKLILEAIIESHEKELSQEFSRADLMQSLTQHFESKTGVVPDNQLDTFCLYNVAEALDGVDTGLPNTHNIDSLAQHSPHFFYHRFMSKNHEKYGWQAVNLKMIKELGPKVLDNAVMIVPSSKEAADLGLIGKLDESNAGLYYGHIAVTKVKTEQNSKNFSLQTVAYRNNPNGNYAISGD